MPPFPWENEILKNLHIHLRAENADVGQVAVMLSVIQTVADDELVRDGEADVVGIQLHAAAVGLIQQRQELDGSGIAGFSRN